MNYEIVLWLLVLIPIFFGGMCALVPARRIALGAMCTGVFSTSVLGFLSIYEVLFRGKTLPWETLPWEALPGVTPTTACGACVPVLVSQ